MKHDLADKWGERLRILETQLKREPADMMLWHWRAQARVLRFLLARYAREPLAPDDFTVPAAAATAPDSSELPSALPSALPTSALERSLLRLALIIPSVANKHSRPAPEDRAAILERIKVARDEGRVIEETEVSWWEEVAVQIEVAAYGGVKARRNALRLSEREAQWKQREHQRREAARERRRWER